MLALHSVRRDDCTGHRGTVPASGVLPVRAGPPAATAATGAHVGTLAVQAVTWAPVAGACEPQRSQVALHRKLSKTSLLGHQFA